MAKRGASKSKRQLIREQRLKRKRRQRLITISVVIGVAVSALLIYLSLKNDETPVGDIVMITPEARPKQDGTAMGDHDAPVLIEVWEDFQCPACRNFSLEVEPLIAENYVAPGKVRYAFRQFPFLDERVPSNESQQSANASMCASEQDRFWDYHDMLFANWDGENIGAFSDKRLVAFAESLSLDMDQFNACFRANRFQDEINQDKADGQQAGVSGTPSVFVDGLQLTPGYVPSYQEVSDAVEAALASSES